MSRNRDTSTSVSLALTGDQGVNGVRASLERHDNVLLLTVEDSHGQTLRFSVGLYSALARLTRHGGEVLAAQLEQETPQ